MAVNRAVSKKRKPELDLDAEKTMFGAFQQAASAVSAMYTLASQQQRKSKEAGAKQALERVASWIYSEYAGSPVVPTAALLEFLQHAHAEAGGNDAADFPVAFPAALPVPPGYECGHAAEDGMLGEQQPGAGGLLRRGAGGGMQISPPKRGSSTSLHQQQQLYAAAQQHQQQQQQQQHAQQMHPPGVQQQQQQMHGFFQGA